MMTAPENIALRGWLPSPVLREKLSPAAWSIAWGLEDDRLGRLAFALEAYAVRLARRTPAAGRAVLKTIGLRAAARLVERRPMVGSALGWLGERRRFGDEDVPFGHWEPAAGPEAGDPRVLTLPVITWAAGEPARLLECIAMDPADATRWWSLTGHVGALGVEAALAAHADGEDGPRKLRLIEHPLAWARAGGETSGAICLLDSRGAMARRVLLDDIGLVCDSLEHAERVKRLQAALKPKGAALFVAEQGRDE